MQELCLSTHLPINSLDAYIARVNRIAVLSVEEEISLGKKLRDHGDLQAAQTLIMAHLRFVVKIARNYLGYGLHLAELIQEGTIGLMKAVKRFDPDKGVRLVTFSVHWIKAEIHEFIIKNWRMVKIATTKAQRKLFFNLRGMKKSYSASSQAEVNNIAKSLGVSTRDVIKMEERMYSNDVSLLGANEEDKSAPIYYLEDQTQNPIEHVINLESQTNAIESLNKHLHALNSRDLDIVKSRWLSEEKCSLKDLATKYKISIERVRQLEVNVKKHLQQAIMAEAG